MITLTWRHFIGLLSLSEPSARRPDLLPLTSVTHCPGPCHTPLTRNTRNRRVLRPSPYFAPAFRPSVSGPQSPVYPPQLPQPKCPALRVRSSSVGRKVEPSSSCLVRTLPTFPKRPAEPTLRIPTDRSANPLSSDDELERPPAHWAYPPSSSAG